MRAPADSDIFPLPPSMDSPPPPPPPPPPLIRMKTSSWALIADQSNTHGTRAPPRPDLSPQMWPLLHHHHHPHNDSSRPAHQGASVKSSKASLFREEEEEEEEDRSMSSSSGGTRTRNGLFRSSRCYAPRRHDIVTQEREYAEEHINNRKSSQPHHHFSDGGNDVRSVHHQEDAEIHHAAGAKRSDPGIRSPDLYVVKRRPGGCDNNCGETETRKSIGSLSLVEQEQRIESMSGYGNCGSLVQRLNFLDAVKRKEPSANESCGIDNLTGAGPAEEKQRPRPTGLDTENMCDGVDSTGSEDQYKMLAQLLSSDSCCINGEFDKTSAHGSISSDFGGSPLDYMGLDLRGGLPSENEVSESKTVIESKSDSDVLCVHAIIEDKIINVNDRKAGMGTANTKNSAVDENVKKITATSGNDLAAFVDVTNKFLINSHPVFRAAPQEIDGHRLNQRQRQIEFGKNTLGYERYIETVPRDKRTKSDPQTPNAKQVCSKRSWDGQIRKWRRLLHEYDPPVEEGEEMAEYFTKFHLISDTEKEGDRSSEPDFTMKDPVVDENQKVMVKDARLEIYEDWMEP